MRCSGSCRERPARRAAADADGAASGAEPRALSPAGDSGADGRRDDAPPPRALAAPTMHDPSTTPMRVRAASLSVATMRSMARLICTAAHPMVGRAWSPIRSSPPPRQMVVRLPSVVASIGDMAEMRCVPGVLEGNARDRRGAESCETNRCGDRHARRRRMRPWVRMGVRANQTMVRTHRTADPGVDGRLSVDACGSACVRRGHRRTVVLAFGAALIRCA